MGFPAGVRGTISKRPKDMNIGVASSSPPASINCLILDNLKGGTHLSPFFVKNRKAVEATFKKKASEILKRILTVFLLIGSHFLLLI
jgi:hypothetical protein